MGRRKKEPAGVHREAIALAAQELFMKNGIAATSMDEIAKLSGYSKATLYVYFESKEEIVGVLTLKSMKKLKDYISEALSATKSTKEKFMLICHSLLRYQEDFPFYFKASLDKININFIDRPYLEEEKETFEVGEGINDSLAAFIKEGISTGELRPDLQTKPVIFSIWSMASGLIQTSLIKEEYISRKLNMARLEFLEYGFDMLYKSISGGREHE